MSTVASCSTSQRTGWCCLLKIFLHHFLALNPPAGVSVLGIKPNPLVWATRPYMNCQPSLSLQYPCLWSQLPTLSASWPYSSQHAVFRLFLVSTELFDVSGLLHLRSPLLGIQPGSISRLAPPSCSQDSSDITSSLRPPTSSPAPASVPLSWGIFFTAPISLSCLVYLFVVCLVCPPPPHWSIRCGEWSSALFIHNTRSPIQNSAWHIVCAQKLCV